MEKKDNNKIIEKNIYRSPIANNLKEYIITKNKNMKYENNKLIG